MHPMQRFPVPAAELSAAEHEQPSSAPRGCCQILARSALCSQPVALLSACAFSCTSFKCGFSFFSNPFIHSDRIANYGWNFLKMLKVLLILN